MVIFIAVLNYQRACLLILKNNILFDGEAMTVSDEEFHAQRWLELWSLSTLTSSNHSRLNVFENYNVHVASDWVFLRICALSYEPGKIATACYGQRLGPMEIKSDPSEYLDSSPCVNSSSQIFGNKLLPSTQLRKLKRQLAGTEEWSAADVVVECSLKWVQEGRSPQMWWCGGLALGKSHHQMIIPW